MAVTINAKTMKTLGLKSSRTPRKGRCPRTEYDNGREIRFLVPIAPKTKSRARTFFNQAGSDAMPGARTLKAHTVTPKTTKAFERSVAEMVAIAMKGAKPFDCPVEVDLVFVINGDANEWPVGIADGDLDNHKKAVLDAMKGVVYTDDRLVVRSRQVKICGPDDGIYCACRPASPALSGLTAWVQMKLAGCKTGQALAFFDAGDGTPAASDAL